jgi:hypothetical protein
MTVKVLDSPLQVTSSIGVPTRSLADTCVSIPELMRLARGNLKRGIDA